MKHKMIWMLGIMLLSMAAMMGPADAIFVQCAGGAGCVGTDDADILNGSAIADTISSGAGDDFIIGGLGDDIITGQDGDDVLFGGQHDDEIYGSAGNDLMWNGPDTDEMSEQISYGEEGNDSFVAFAGEILGCLSFIETVGTDTVNLIGFGPYVATKPFGQPGFGAGFVIVTDPISGGLIVIEVNENTDDGIETINGLTSPNVVIGTLPAGCSD